jgi:hypothetical protein
VRYGKEEMGENQMFLAPFAQNGIRAPRSLLELGDGGRKVAITREDRLALFQERAIGGEGAWPA